MLLTCMHTSGLICNVKVKYVKCFVLSSKHFPKELRFFSAPCILYITNMSSSPILYYHVSNTFLCTHPALLIWCFFFYSPFSFSFANLALTLVSSSPTDTLKVHCSLLDSRRSNLGHSFQFGRDGNFNKDYDRKNTVKVCIQYCLILW